MSNVALRYSMAITVACIAQQQHNKYNWATLWSQSPPQCQAMI